jgi:hypothetical protein
MRRAIVGALRLQAALLILVGSTLSGCRTAALQGNPGWSPAISREAPSPMPGPTATPADSPQPTSDPIAGRYGFPAEIDPSARYLFCLHGKIVEDQGLPAVSPEFGEYQYEEILEALASYGFVVISEQRPKDADGWAYAAKGAKQVAELIHGNVPPGHITVVGASKGASIATGISYLVGNPEVNYVLLGTCHPTLLEDWRQQGVTLSGNVLALYDFADDEYSGSCEDLFARSEGKGLNRHEELVLQVGTGHGILYQPLDAWVIPTVHWAMQEW